MKTAISPRSNTSGFSLIEMLTTVAILGIMSSMALAWFGGNGSEVQMARDQRNAQSVCSLCQVADAAGLNLAAETSSPLEIVRRLAEGVTIEKGALKGRIFRIPGLGLEEAEGAARYLDIRNGQLRYEIKGRPSNGKSDQNGQI